MAISWMENLMWLILIDTVEYMKAPSVSTLENNISYTKIQWWWNLWMNSDDMMQSHAVAFAVCVKIAEL